MMSCSTAFDENVCYNMSKKIAQLTKVIYTLNCKNEDNEARTQWLQNKHASELASLVKDCDKRIFELAERARQVESAKKDELAAIEERHKQLLQDARNHFGDRVRSMVSDVEKCKKQFNETLADIRDSKNASLSSELTRVKQLKDDEMAQLVTEYNDRFKAMLSDQLDEKDALEKRLNEEWGTKMDRLTSQLRQHQQESAGKLEVADQKLCESLERNADLQRQIEALLAHTHSLTEKIGSLEWERSELEERLLTECSNLGATRDAEVELRRRLEQLQRGLSAAEADRDSARQSLQAAQAEKNKLLSDRTATENEKALVETQNASLASTIESLKGDIGRFSRERDDLLGRLASLSSSSEGKDATVKRLQEEANASMEETRRWKLQMEMQSEAHESELGRMRAEHEQRIQRLQQDLQASSAVMTAQQEKEMADREAAALLQLTHLSEHHVTELALLQQKHAADVEALERRLAAAQSDEGALAGQLTKLQDNHASLEATLKEREKRIADVEGELQANREQYETITADLREQLETAKGRGEADLNAQQQLLEEQQSKFDTELCALQMQHQEEVVRIREEWQKTLAEARTANDESTARIHREHLQELQDLQRRLEHCASKEVSDAEQRWMEKQDRLEKERQRENEEAGAIERTLRSHIDDLQRQLDLAEKAATAEHVNSTREMGDLRLRVSQLERDLADQRVAHQAACEDARVAHVASMEKCLSEERECHRRVLEEIRKTMAEDARAHSESMEALQSEMKQRLQEEEEKHKLHLEELRVQVEGKAQEVITGVNAAHNQHVLDLQLRADEAVAAVRRELDSARDEIESGQKELEEVRMHLEQRVAEADQARCMIEEERQRGQEALLSLRTEHDVAVAAMSKEHNAELSHLADTHKRLSDDYRQQQAQERRAHQAMLDKLRDSLTDLQHKYDFRESRQEDVELINKLLQDAQLKKKELETAYADMRMYKLELVNREESYNKVFGRKPVVSVPADGSGGAATTLLPTLKTSASRSRNVSK